MKILLFISYVFMTTPGFSQEKPDSVVVNFYKWYLGAIKTHQTAEYQPCFVEGRNGTTTLGFDKYSKNLRTYGFSESLIEQEIKSYLPCLNEIEKISYKELDNKLQDIEDYTKINCDFFNSCRWTATIETIDGVKILNITSPNDITRIVKGRFFNFDGTKREYYYWDLFCYCTMRISDNNWKIEKIEIKNK